jgi:hypothetical protein
VRTRISIFAFVDCTRYTTNFYYGILSRSSIHMLWHPVKDGATVASFAENVARETSRGGLKRVLRIEYQIDAPTPHGTAPALLSSIRRSVSMGKHLSTWPGLLSATQLNSLALH